MAINEQSINGQVCRNAVSPAGDYRKALNFYLERSIDWCWMNGVSVRTGRAEWFEILSAGISLAMYLEEGPGLLALDVQTIYISGILGELGLDSNTTIEPFLKQVVGPAVSWLRDSPNKIIN